MCKNLLLAALVLFGVRTISAADPSAAAPYLDVNLPVDQRVADLISRLSLAEKAQLLNHRGPTLERLHIRSETLAFNFCRSVSTLLTAKCFSVAAIFR